jgi:hypothetical protein
MHRHLQRLDPESKVGSPLDSLSNVFWNCCENVSHVLTNDEFQKAVASVQWSQCPEKQPLVEEAGQQKLATGH